MCSSLFLSIAPHLREANLPPVPGRSEARPGAGDGDGERRGPGGAGTVQGAQRAGLEGGAAG